MTDLKPLSKEDLDKIRARPIAHTELERRLLATIGVLEKERDHQSKVLDHLGSWKDAKGCFYDLTNPEAQVQPIIDAACNLESRQKKLVEALTELESISALVAAKIVVQKVLSSNDSHRLRCAIDASKVLREIGGSPERDRNL